jgi:Fe-S oxidoreductase
MLEVTDMIVDVGGEQMLRCMQCGTCTGVCPWPKLKSYSPRNIFRLASLGLCGYEDEDLWSCVTCNTCVTRCPRSIDLVDVIRATRSVLLEAGTAPPTYSSPLGSLQTEGNPWSADRDKRYEWAVDLDLKPYDENCDYLYFTCCTQAYDPRNKKVAKSLIACLREGKVNFGVLDEKESCCGDQARKVGSEELYQQLKSSNNKIFQKKGVKDIIVSSPHCMQAFNLDYSESKKLNAKHYTQLLNELIKENLIVPKKSLNQKITYHDPCYLGRHAGEYEAPREVLRSIPGLELVEMPRNRETSLCCGGGGGGLWLEVPQEQRFAILRVQEALDVGASIIATACPYCTLMLEDAVKVLDLEEKIEIKDVAELLHESFKLPSETVEEQPQVEE